MDDTVDDAVDDTRPPSAVHVYRVLIGARLRAQLVYRTSFALDLLGSVMVAVTDFVEVYVIFHNVPTLGGLDAAEAFLLFGLGTVGFSLANVMCGNLDTVPEYIRSGTLEVMLLRPMPLLAQLVTGDVRLKRLGQAVVGVVVLAAALLLADVRWTPFTVAVLVVTPLSGGLVFAAIFVAAGAAQFWLVDAGELSSSFTFGGQYASRYSFAVLPLPVRLLFAFVVPAAFTAYLPTLVILGRPGPPWLPGWLGWCSPLVAVLAWGASLALWRRGVRHYTGAGG